MRLNHGRIFNYNKSLWSNTRAVTVNSVPNPMVGRHDPRLRGDDQGRSAGLLHLASAPRSVGAIASQRPSVLSIEGVANLGAS